MMNIYIYICNEIFSNHIDKTIPIYGIYRNSNKSIDFHKLISPRKKCDIDDFFKKNGYKPGRWWQSHDLGENGSSSKYIPIWYDCIVQPKSSTNNNVSNHVVKPKTLRDNNVSDAEETPIADQQLEPQLRNRHYVGFDQQMKRIITGKETEDNCKKYFEKDGWEILKGGSGYDFNMKKGNEELHIEVKSTNEFLITENEKNKLQEDKMFRIAIPNNDDIPNNDEFGLYEKINIEINDEPCIKIFKGKKIKK